MHSEQWLTQRNSSMSVLLSVTLGLSQCVCVLAQKIFPSSTPSSSSRSATVPPTLLQNSSSVESPECSKTSCAMPAGGKGQVTVAALADIPQQRLETTFVKFESASYVEGVTARLVAAGSRSIN